MGACDLSIDNKIEFGRAFIASQIRDKGECKVFKKETDDDPFDALTIVHLGKVNLIAVDEDGDEDTFKIKEIVKDYESTPPREEDRKYDLEEEFTFYLSTKGELAIVLNNSPSDDALLESTEYRLIKLK